MLKIAKPDINIEYCNKLEQLLIRYPLSRESDKVQAISNNNKIDIAYLTEGNLREGTTYFDLELREDVCDILEFFIKEEQKGKGYGRIIYSIIEEFTKYFKCKRIQVTPSGEGTTFWPYMGFNEKCEFGIEKLLQ